MCHLCPKGALVSFSWLQIRTQLINGERVRCGRFGAGGRREKGADPCWICNRRATRRQRQRYATLRAKFWRAAGCVAPQSQNARLCSFVASCQQPARASRTHSPFMRWVLMVSTRTSALYRCSCTLRAVSLIQLASLTALAANRNCASWLTSLEARSNDGPITALPAEHFLA